MTATAGISWIGFLSDYGLSDCHVGVCHGVIASTAPTARVIDLCHEVPPGDLRRGSALLAPDNGLLLPAAKALGGASAAYEITARTYLRQPVSATFRGRDVFAPVAAH